MDVMPGYKRTAIGEIPTEWEITSLGKLVDRTRTIRYGIVQPGEYRLSGCLMLRSQDYSRGWAGPDEMHRISFNLEQQFRNARLRRGDLIMTIVGAGIGQVAIAPPWLDGAILSRSTARIAVDENEAAPLFVAATLTSSVGQRQVFSRQKEGAQPVVSCRELSHCLVPKPPLAEQIAIAEALSDADFFIESLEQLLAKKRRLKQAAMQELLTGKRRLPGFEGEWQVQSIGGLIDLVTGFPFPSSGFAKSGVRLLRGSNVKRGVTDWSEGLVQYWPRHSIELTDFELQEGDLVISMDGSLVGRSYAHLTPSDLPALLLQRVARIRSKKLDIGFLTQHVGSVGFVNYCDSVKTVTAIPHISAADIRHFTTACPPTLAEQSAVAEVLCDMDSQIADTESKLTKARNIKQGMMQELLTGRIRLT